MGVAVGMMILAALPVFGDPALLVDIDTGPSRTVQARLVEANEQGVLYMQVERDGGTALFWSTWEAAPQRVTSVNPYSSVKARRLGDGFIVFTGAEVHRLDVSPSPRLTLLVTVSRVNRFIETNSTTAVWWAGPEGTFVTDGTPEGTRLFTTASDGWVALGNSLYFYGSTIRRVDEAGFLVDTGVSAFAGVVRAGNHLVASGTSVRNELGEELSPLKNCLVASGGAFAWISCPPFDGGPQFMITDGTPAGTQTLFELPRGELFVIRNSSEDYLLLSGGPMGLPPQLVLLSRDGTRRSLDASCLRVNAMIGDVLVASDGFGSLKEGGDCGTASHIEEYRQVGRRALLQRNHEARFLLTDGTNAGSEEVPAQLPDWPTASSEPQLVGSDGVRAIYSTTQGAWVTDGTASGTKRVGVFAELFGHSVLAQEDGRFVAFAENGERWEPPMGVLGAAGGLLIGRNGCDAFTIDEARVRRELSVGCVEEIKLRSDGALIRNTKGTTSLVRVDGTFLLVGDVELAGGARCGKTVCWYVTREGTTGRANVVDLESAANSAIPGVLTQNGLQLLAATDSMLVLTHSLGTFAVGRDGGRIVMENTQFTLDPPLHFGVTASGVIVWFSAASSGALKANDSDIDLPCSNYLALSVTGDRVNVLCTTLSPQPEIELWSGTLKGGLESIAMGKLNVDETPYLPSGNDEVIGFMMARESERSVRLVVTDGKERREFPGLLAGGLVKVRGGYVFLATEDAVPDFELWVLPLPPPSGCGCSGGGGTELMVLLGVLLLRRRTTVA